MRWAVLAAGAAAVIGASGGGCSYTAHVRNTTEGPVQVRLIQRQALKRDWTLDSARVPPGETVRLGPARVSMGKVLLQAGEHTRTMEPAWRQLRRGETRLEIWEGAEGEPVLRSPPPPAPLLEEGADEQEDAP